MVIDNIEQERLSRLEGAYEQVSRRLDDLYLTVNTLRTEMNSRFAEVNSRFDEVYSRMDSRFAEVDSRFAEVNSRFDELNSRINVLIVVMVGAWMTIIAALIALYLK